MFLGDDEAVSMSVIGTFVEQSDAALATQMY